MVDVYLAQAPQCWAASAHIFAKLFKVLSEATPVVQHDSQVLVECFRLDINLVVNCLKSGKLHYFATCHKHCLRWPASSRLTSRIQLATLLIAAFAATPTPLPSLPQHYERQIIIESVGSSSPRQLHSEHLRYVPQ